MQSMILNGEMLWLTYYYLEHKVCLQRIVIAAFLGAIFEMICIMCRGIYGCVFVIWEFMDLFMMHCVCTPKSSITYKCKCMTASLGIIAAVTLCSGMVIRVMQLKMGSFWTKCIIFAVVFGAVKVCRMLNVRRTKTIFQVVIYINREKIYVKGLWDSGNSLREPETGKMISIVEKARLAEIREKGLLPKREVQYHSLGAKNGVLSVYEADQMIIQTEQGPVVQYEMLIGEYDGILSSRGEFQMILHRDCIKEGKRNESNLAHIFTKTN